MPGQPVARPEPDQHHQAHQQHQQPGRKRNVLVSHVHADATVRYAVIEQQAENTQKRDPKKVTKPSATEIRMFAKSPRSPTGIPNSFAEDRAEVEAGIDMAEPLSKARAVSCRCMPKP